MPKLNEFRTRKQFNEWKEQVATFTNRANLDYQFVKNDFGVVANKKQLMQIKQNTKRAQREAKALIRKQQNKPVIYRGKQIATQGQRMQMMASEDAGGITVPPDFDFNKMRTERQFEDKSRAMELRADKEYFDKKMERMQLNFMDALAIYFNGEADELIEMVDQLSAKEFWEMYQMFDEFDFDAFYRDGRDDDSDLGNIKQMEDYTMKYIDETRSQEKKEHLDKIMTHIRNFNEGNVDRSLENF